MHAAEFVHKYVTTVVDVGAEVGGEVADPHVLAMY